jgi:hypothetical protein
MSYVVASLEAFDRIHDEPGQCSDLALSDPRTVGSVRRWVWGSGWERRVWGTRRRVRYCEFADLPDRRVEYLNFHAIGRWERNCASQAERRRRRGRHRGVWRRETKRPVEVEHGRWWGHCVGRWWARRWCAWVEVQNSYGGWSGDDVTILVSLCVSCC